MAIEISHGKARPTLPRSSDLSPVDTARDPSVGRTVGGRFGPGNKIANGARWKQAIKRLLGRVADGQEAEAVGRDSWKIFLATLRAMPSDAAPVRSLVALHARHVAVASFFTNKAAAVGLDTKEGLAFLEVASHHGQRAERTAVTALDVATKLAKKIDETAADLLSDFKGGGR
jgi:hypothetical protein